MTLLLTTRRALYQSIFHLFPDTGLHISIGILRYPAILPGKIRRGSGARDTSQLRDIWDEGQNAQ